MTTIRALAFSLTVLICSGLLEGAEADPPGRLLAGRVFATSRYDIDEILARPYDREVPMGCTGDRVWASSPQGWAFRDDVHWLYLTNLNAFDIEIHDEHSLLAPARATYYPSHIHYEGVLRKEMTASASFTYARDKVENPLTEPFEPRKRWTCWSSGKRQDWFAVEFATPHTLIGFNVNFFNDAPSGGCRPPDSFEVQYFDGRFHSWNPVKLIKAFPGRPREGENRVRFEPVQSTRFRLVLRNAGSDFYTGIYGLKPINEVQKDAASPSSPLQFTGDKFITADDLLVSVIRVHNPTDRVQTIYAEPIIQPATTFAYEWVGSISGLLTLKEGEVSGREPRFLTLDGRQELHGETVYSRFRYAAVDDPPRTLEDRCRSIGPGDPI